MISFGLCFFAVLSLIRKLFYVSNITNQEGSYLRGNIEIKNEEEGYS